MKGKRIVVTGVSSGIGKALAEKCVAAGAEVVGLCRRVAEAPDGVKVLACDLTSEADVRGVFSKLGPFDVLVNNAGVGLMSKITDGDLDDWDLMWQVNVRALALCSQLALKHFDGPGQIINVSSMSGHRVPPGGGFYAPTKFAVRAITESLRLELRAMKSSVRVSSVSPGFVDTPLLNDYFKGREDVLANTKASIKMLEPEDIAQVICNIMQTPIHVEVGDVLLRSVDQGV